ncbi:hypothetical protein E6C55_31055 [Cohnella fermenti]|uniref:Uncharacterized protein n=1 Tax=Cohnella fermenti TaxID=2565925 RepID=A0A4S4BL53_9BACL|nr:hypothetical protein E6C55_31055 [Cohnella fermenti]
MLGKTGMLPEERRFGGGGAAGEGGADLAKKQEKKHACFMRVKTSVLIPFSGPLTARFLCEFSHSFRPRTALRTFLCDFSHLSRLRTAHRAFFM